ncbi:UDP-N-acetylenolpyruvoylglucosamine reductase [Planosporangium mesophilum]|uniref:UDP-N-acetylenolpyruvoylglucosamine reductase n=1 Tax=Planosporangium mesophilum TaxID=689768 RepID=A0A8J3T969_9ACTN|nr:UDP-N-acetylenolpyruvoylglucosamine reductase [Planosporangium mesophilum]
MSERTHHEMLNSHTTLRLGGPAAELVEASSADEIVAALRKADASGSATDNAAVSAFVLAGGSNVVVADEGYPGTVVLLRNRGFSVHREGERATVRVEAGQQWDELVEATVADGLAGLECLSGIPGSAGATPIQNVGAYGQEVAETITAIRVYDRYSGETLVMRPDECLFGYRTSIFKHNNRFVVLSVDFSLTVSTLSTPIRYAELARSLGVAPGEQADLARVREAVLALRAGKGMVLDPSDPDTWSVGSFFTNPVLPASEYAALRERAGAQPPAWPGADGSVKVSAAWLIERAGFGKGHAGVGVGISTKHTLALTNRGTGTTAALLDLAREIRDGVRDRFGVVLHPEPVLVNCAL